MELIIISFTWLINWYCLILSSHSSSSSLLSFTLPLIGISIAERLRDRGFDTIICFDDSKISSDNVIMGYNDGRIWWRCDIGMLWYDVGIVWWWDIMMVWWCDVEIVWWWDSRILWYYDVMMV